ncbi:MAG: hypothetical protein QOD31_3499, partial [Pseudonocardiales bacterium]|nr:hypothetical protein [Pseudonocardiales bacterium]
MTTAPRSKAELFVEFAEAHRWSAGARPITHRDYADKRHKQAGWTAIARRDSEIVTATWIDEVAIGPIGWHSTDVVNEPI